MTTRGRGLIVVAALIVLAASSARAGDNLSGVRTVAELRPLVERLESAESPPGAGDLALLQQAVEAVRAEIDALPDPEGGETPSKDLAEARALIRRADAIQLGARVEELHPAVEALVDKAPALDGDDLVWIEQVSDELEAEIAKIRRPTTGPEKNELDGVRRARGMVAGLLLLELATRVETLRSSLEALETGRAEATAEEFGRVNESMEHLRAGLDVFEAVRDAEQDPEAVRAAYELIRRLAIVTLTAAVARMTPIVEQLESSEERPSKEEMDRYRVVVDGVRFQIEEFENSAPDTEEGPPAIISEARQLFQRLALYELRVGSETLGAHVAELESREPPISPDELKLLREDSARVRESIQRIRGEAKEDSAVPDEDAPAEVKAARDLLARAGALVPPDRIAPEEPQDSPATQPTLRAFKFYGSIRLRYMFGPEKDVFDDDTSRAGVRAESPLWNKVRAFGRFEIAVHVLDDPDDGDQGGDPGIGDNDEDNNLTIRLGYIGVEGDWGWGAFGKQWSAYWDVAVFTDQLPVFTGVPTGAFNAGTDGGLSGTGRADDAVQYRNTIDTMKFTAQIQSRNKTTADPGLVDTYGFSSVYDGPRGIDFGVAFNRVRDGIDDPGPNQPKEDDTALILGARYNDENNKWYAAATLSITENHEQDDLDRFYDGAGFELYANYDLFENIRLVADFSYLTPGSSHPGEYEFMTATIGARYRFFRDQFFVYLLGKADLGTRSDGTDSGDDRVAVVLRLNF